MWGKAALRACLGDSNGAVRRPLREGVAHVTSQGRRDPEDLVFGTGLRGREAAAILTHAADSRKLQNYEIYVSAWLNACMVRILL